LQSLWTAQMGVELFHSSEIRIAPRPEAPTCTDTLLLLALARSKRAMQEWWRTVGAECAASLLALVTRLFEDVVHSAGPAGQQPLPRLRTGKGHARRQESLSVRLALEEARRVKGHQGTVHRMQAATVNPEVNREVPWRRLQMHLRACAEAFRGVRRFGLAWDPSLHGGEDTLVMVLYVPTLDRAAYWPDPGLPPASAARARHSESYAVHHTGPAHRAEGRLHGAPGG
jgi:hypothetical protein